MSQISSSTSLLTLTEAREIRDTQGALVLHDLVVQRAKADQNNTVIVLDDTAPAAADGPLAGIPFGVKDNIDCLPFGTTGGSPALLSNRPASDAPVVAQLKSAGGYVPVKLNMHELAFGVTSNNAHFGPVATPFDLTRVAGGSSGGSAAAVAQGIVPFALGTDTGGSTRIPATFCGIVGFRPSTGRYPDGGVLTLSTTRDTIGPMATCVADVQEVDAILVPGDAAWPEIDRPLKIGLIYRDAGLSPDLDRHFAQVVAAIEEAGLAQFVPIDIPEFIDLEPRLGSCVVANEVNVVWSKFCQDSLGLSYSAFAEKLASPDVKGAFSAMPELAAASAKTYAAVQQEGLAQLRATYARVFAENNLDAIAMPTVPVPPPLIGEDKMIETHLGPKPTFPTIISNTTLASLTGAPSLSLPAGVDAQGLPVGFMVESSVGSDRFLLAVGRRIEKILQQQ